MLKDIIDEFAEVFDLETLEISELFLFFIF